MISIFGLTQSNELPSSSLLDKIINDEAQSHKEIARRYFQYYREHKFMHYEGIMLIGNDWCEVYSFLT